jgi:hypothetical protein
LAITDGDGIAGDPTITLAGQVLNLSNLSANGLMVITTAGALSATSILNVADQTAVTNADGTAGNPTIGLASNPIIPGTGSILIPVGTTGQRSSGVDGRIRYNSTDGAYEGYSTGAWRQFSLSGGVTQVDTGTGLTGGPITGTGTISISNTTVTAGSYGSSTQVGTFTVNAQGQLTAAANTTITPSGIGAVASVSGTANEITATGASIVVLSLPAALTFTSKTVTGGTFNMTAATVGADTVTTNTATQTLTNKTISGLSNTLSNIANASLTNSSVTVGTTAIALGASSLTLGGLTSVAVTQDPTSALQLATKQYVDAVAEGLHIHASCAAATPGTLASITGGTVTYNNGTAGVGATLTLSVALTVLDGYTLLNGDRVLVKNEATQANNGIYTWATGGTVLTRATDFDTAAEMASGDFTFISNGTLYANTGWVQTDPVTVVGTSPVTWIQFSGAGTYTAGTGLTLTGNQFSITNTAVTAAAYGSASSVGTFTVNAQGQLTLAASTSIAINGNQITSGTVGVAYGGTGLASYAIGDMVYASGTTTISKLALGASGYVLTAGASEPQYVAQSTLSVGSATNATNVAITANSTNATNYLTFVSATTGNLPQLVNSAITCNPSTGQITGGISGGTF